MRRLTSQAHCLLTVALLVRRRAVFLTQTYGLPPVLAVGSQYLKVRRMRTRVAAHGLLRSQDKCARDVIQGRIRAPVRG